MITFVDKFELFHKKVVTVFIFIIVLLMIYTFSHEDYGLLLLLVALFVLSFNMSYLKGS